MLSFVRLRSFALVSFIKSMSSCDVAVVFLLLLSLWCSNNSSKNTTCNGNVFSTFNLHLLIFFSTITFEIKKMRTLASWVVEESLLIARKCRNDLALVNTLRANGYTFFSEYSSKYHIYILFFCIWFARFFYLYLILNVLNVCVTPYTSSQNRYNYKIVVFLFECMQLIAVNRITKSNIICTRMTMTNW